METEGLCCHTRRPRRSLVTDINVWTKCYATMAAILTTVYPHKAPQFFAYLRTITKASCTFKSAAWATYDMTYRRQAANRGSLDWAAVDPALYSEAFAGRAKLIARCKILPGRYTHIPGVCPCTIRREWSAAGRRSSDTHSVPPRGNYAPICGRDSRDISAFQFSSRQVPAMLVCTCVLTCLSYPEGQ